MESQLRVSSAHRMLMWWYALLAGGYLAASLVLSGLVVTLETVMALTLFGALGLTHFLVARGCRRGSPAARTASIVIGGLLLFGFPIGTAIGVYILFNARGPWFALPDPLGGVA